MILSKESKNIIAVLVAASVIALAIAWTPVAYARISFLQGDNVVESSDAVDNVSARLLLAGETTATSTSLVDLSDETNFPHNAGSAIEVSKIIFDWQTETVASTTIKVGLIASSTDSGSNVDVYWFDTVNFNSNDSDSSRQQRVLDYSDSVVKLGISSGKPSGFLANDSDLYTADFATTTQLLSPNEYINLGVGDLVMQVFSQKGIATTSAHTIYRVR